MKTFGLSLRATKVNENDLTWGKWVTQVYVESDHTVCV